MIPKDTIYIDIDDEITAVINKVIASKTKLVVLVLPKRASVFHSSVNLKLLKNKANKAEKNLVLVSTDTNLLSLAGVVGINVAKNLQDKPSIPTPNLLANSLSGAGNDQSEADEKQNKSIGEVAAMSSVGVADIGDQDVIEFDNDAKKDEVVDPGKMKLLKDAKKQMKKIKVPDFGKFQKILIISVIAIILIVAAYVAGFIYLPKATITIQSSTSTLSNAIPLTLDSTQSTLDTKNMVVPANVQTVQKTVASNAMSTTGTKQIGIYATGTITVTNPGNSYSSDIPPGTIFTDTSTGYTYQSISDATLYGCKTSGGVCNPPISTPVKVEATAYGTNYNLLYPKSDYTTTLSTIATTGNPAVTNNFSGTAMSGATTPSTVNIVAQADIDSATKQIVAPDTTAIKLQLTQAIKAAGYVPLASTFVAAVPVISPSNTVGTQTNTVTVSGAYSYSMYGAYLSDLDTLITNQINQSSSFNSSKQSILTTGSASAIFTVQSSTPTAIKANMQVSSVVGPKLDVNQLKTQSIGQSSANVINNISNIPGVKTVTIKYSPFWVTSMPHSVKKVTIIIEKADGTKL
ncbi:MAG TPA: hypothetical protein VMV24_02825 [Candidatus Dormibacteraeota bacterium]|nr:hypothetical protein [Candidatus Dormibacteraeota bacterium]